MNKLKLLIAFISGLAFCAPASATLYKWVDDTGTTHYGETIPPEYADKSRVELNKEGREVKKLEVLTPEQRQAERDAKVQADEKKRVEDAAAIERKRHDQTLLSTYSSVKEIDLARSRNLQQVDARINLLNSYVKIANDNLLDLQKEAEGYTNNNKVIPESLKEDMGDAQKLLDKRKKDLESPLAEKAAVEARFDADRARYMVLTGKKE